MVELYVGSGGYVNFDLVGTAATGTPTAVLVRPGVADVSLVVTQSTPTPSGLAQRWQAYVPATQTSIQDSVVVEFSAVVSAENITRQVNVNISVPYITPEQVSALYGWSFNPSDTNYRSYEEIANAERIARTIINRFTRKSFGPKTGVVDAYGQNTDVLVLPETIYSFSELYENGMLVATPLDFAEFGYDIEITSTNKAIRIISPDYYDLAESEALRVTGTTGRFRLGYRYTVVGEFGTAFVPQDIADATGMLINDYMCRDAIWRARYINHVEMRDWKFNFEKEAFRGTGNVIVDQMLSEYRSPGMFII
jgi:hypothetical protein